MGRDIYKLPVDMSEACSVFNHKQVFTDKFRI